MILTEENARFKTCCNKKSLCVTFNCMAWCWENKGNYGKKHNGYCGLAGVPFEIDQESKLDLLRLQVALQNEHHNKNVQDELNAAVARVQSRSCFNHDDVNDDISPAFSSALLKPEPDPDLGIVPRARYKLTETVFYISGGVVYEATIDSIDGIDSVTFIYYVSNEYVVGYRISEGFLYSTANDAKDSIKVYGIGGKRED